MPAWRPDLRTASAMIRVTPSKAKNPNFPRKSWLGYLKPRPYHASQNQALQSFKSQLWSPAYLHATVQFWVPFPTPSRSPSTIYKHRRLRYSDPGMTLFLSFFSTERTSSKLQCTSKLSCTESLIAMVHFAITSGRPPTFKTNLWRLDSLCTEKQLGWLRYKQLSLWTLGNTSQAVTPMCTFRHKWAHVTTRIVIILSFIIVFVSVSASALSTRTQRASLPFLPNSQGYGAQPRCKLWCNSWFHFHKPRNPIPETKRPTLTITQQFLQSPCLSNFLLPLLSHFLSPHLT